MGIFGPALRVGFRFAEEIVNIFEAFGAFPRLILERFKFRFIDQTFARSGVETHARPEKMESDRSFDREILDGPTMEGDEAGLAGHDTTGGDRNDVRDAIRARDRE